MQPDPDCPRPTSAGLEQQPAFVSPQPQQPGNNPGKGLGIAGFVLAFVFPLVGLPLSIVGFVKSKKVNMPNGLALAGIILNGLFVLLSAFIIPVTLVAYAGIQGRVRTQSAETAAINLVKAAEMYNAENAEYDGELLTPRYPKAFADVALTSGEGSPVLASAALTDAPAQPEVVEFYACGDQTGNKVGYWDYTESRVVYEYAGEAGDSSEDCTLVTQ